MQVGKQMMEHAALFPDGEHPMPEGMRKCLICNAPAWIGGLCSVQP